MRKQIKRVVALLMTLVLAFELLPLQPFAAEEGAAEAGQTDTEESKAE